jgi:hypothetical protein
MLTETWTAEQYREFVRTGQAPGGGVPAKVEAVGIAQADAVAPSPAPSPVPDFLKPAAPAPRMNKTEAAFAAYLTARGLTWQYEALKLNLGHRCWYTPDFVVFSADPLLFVEVKGFWRDDARAKIKSAARRYPAFRFVAVQHKRGAWVPEEIKP